MLYLRRRRLPHRTLMVVDAVGLAVVTVIGARAAIDAQVTPAAVLVLAVLTGVTGEVVRDVLCGEFPPLLLREEVYATAALAGAAAYLALHSAGAPDPVTAAPPRGWSSYSGWPRSSGTCTRPASGARPAGPGPVFHPGPVLRPRDRRPKPGRRGR
ncbi:TRIC cation channel family protein [Streptomyces sp. NPDC048551]|uniref:TRIC cation channel family protein n=1 Tax=Streptomyces sp. NPDC048551 TaxID=3155758 RepID=UPI00342B0946